MRTGSWPALPSLSQATQVLGIPPKFPITWLSSPAKSEKFWVSVGDWARLERLSVEVGWNQNWNDLNQNWELNKSGALAHFSKIFIRLRLICIFMQIVQGSTWPCFVLFYANRISWTHGTNSQTKTEILEMIGGWIIVVPWCVRENL